MHIMIILVAYVISAVIFDYCCYYQSAIIISLQNKGPGSEKIMKKVGWIESAGLINGIISLLGMATIVFGYKSSKFSDLLAFSMALIAILYAYFRYRMILSLSKKQ